MYVEINVVRVFKAVPLQVHLALVLLTLRYNYRNLIYSTIDAAIEIRLAKMLTSDTIRYTRLT